MKNNKQFQSKLRAAQFFMRVRMLGFIAWRNIWRNRMRSALTISALSIGLTLVIFYSAMLEGMTRQMIEFATDISTGHMQVHRQAYVDDQDIYATLPWQWLAEIEKQFPALSFAPRLYAAGLASTNETSIGVLIKAIDPHKENKTSKLLGQIREGSNDLENIHPGPDGLHIYPVIIGAHLAKNHNIKPGDELILMTQAIDGSIGNALYYVTGILKPVEPAFDRIGVLMSLSAYQDLMYLYDGFHELVVKTENINTIDYDQQQIKTVITQLEKKYPLDELGGKAITRNWRELAAVIADMLEMSQSVIWIIGFIVIALASLGVMNTMLMAIHERTHEFGILLAIGMKTRWILFMILVESFFLSLVAAVLGIVLAVLAINAFPNREIDLSRFMPDGFDWAGMVFEPMMKLYIEPKYMLIAMFLLIGIALIAALIASSKTLRMKPAEVLK